jgi:hypothetical protein
VYGQFVFSCLALYIVYGQFVFAVWPETLCMAKGCGLVVHCGLICLRLALDSYGWLLNLSVLRGLGEAEAE